MEMVYTPEGLCTACGVEPCAEHKPKGTPRCGICGLFMRKLDTGWRCVRLRWDGYYGAYEHE